MSDPSQSASAIVVAAGQSRRMGFDKLATPLAGIPVLVHTVRVFLAHPSVAEVIVVGAPDRAELLDAAGLAGRYQRVPGGAERHQSVWQGLLAATQPWVMVHDAARPLVSQEIIHAVLQAAFTCGAAAAAKKVADTLKKSRADGIVSASVDRTDLWAMETPQTFRTDLLREAYTAVLAAGEGVTDEVSAVQRLGHPVQLVESTQPNFKITTQSDLALAEALQNLRAS